MAEALLLHDETWGVRALDDGPVMQVCRDATHPVVTVLGVRRVDAFDEVGAWLGVGIANLVAAFDPELVVIGGGVSAAGDLLLDPARAALEQSLVGAAHRVIPPIVRGRFGPESGIVGAATLARTVH